MTTMAACYRARWGARCCSASMPENPTRVDQDPDPGVYLARGRPTSPGTRVGGRSSVRRITVPSLDDQARITAGADDTATHALAALEHPSLRLSDGPNGVDGIRYDERDPSLCTPCGTALAASWDRALVGAVGRLIGAEARRKGVHVVLGPVVNVPRSPLGGRAFESF